MRRHEPYGSPGGLSPRERGRIQLAAAIVLAVTVVLSVGPAVATHLVVRSSDIVNGQVKAVDLGLGAVTTGKVANGAITSSKIRDDGVTRADLAPGVVAARAFGTIWWPGTIVSNSQNFSAANVSRPSTGQYCIFGLPFTPVNAARGDRDERLERGIERRARVGCGDHQRLRQPLSCRDADLDPRLQPGEYHAGRQQLQHHHLLTQLGDALRVRRPAR